LNEIKFDIKAFKNFSNNFRSNLKKIEQDIELSLDEEKFKLQGVHRTLGETLLGAKKLFEIPDLIKNKMLPCERIFLQTSVTEYIDRIYNKENPYSNFIRNRLFKFLEEYWNEGKNGKQNGSYYHLISLIIHDWNPEISCDDDIKIESSFPAFAFDFFGRFQNREQLSPAEPAILKQFVLDSLICFINNSISNLEKNNAFLNDLYRYYETDQKIESEPIPDAKPETQSETPTLQPPQWNPNGDFSKIIIEKKEIKPTNDQQKFLKYCRDHLVEEKSFNIGDLKEHVTGINNHACFYNLWHDSHPNGDILRNVLFTKIKKNIWKCRKLWQYYKTK